MIRRRSARVLLKEHRRFDAARISLQDRRPVLEEGHDERTDSQVVAKQIELGKFFRRPVDAIETRERDALAFDLQNQSRLSAS